MRQIDLPEDQHPETLIGLCRDLVDALPQVTRVCLHHLRIQEHPGGHADGIDLRRSYPYGAGSRRCVLWRGQAGKRQVLSARLYDMAALYQLAGLVGTMRDSRTAEQVFHQLIWMNEHRED